jgi:hypothetical protein
MVETVVEARAASVAAVEAALERLEARVGARSYRLAMRQQALMMSC